MNYTKGEWEVIEYPLQGHFIGNGEVTIATIHEVYVKEAKANAHLIAAAVNACINLNPDNPMAVAESITEMYEALKKIRGEGTRCLDLVQQDKPVREVYKINEVDRIARQALAKADGGKR